MNEEVRGPIVVFDKFLTPEQCSETIEYCREHESAPAMIDEGTLNESIRKNTVYNVSSNRGTPAMMTGAALNINWDVFKFDISHVSQSDLLEYGPGGKFNTHIDTFMLKNDTAQTTRKLTSLMILNDEFEGGELTVYHQFGQVTFTNENMGDLIVFPSYMMHGVVPVTSGIRYSIVNWLLGPSFT